MLEQAATPPQRLPGVNLAGPIGWVENVSTSYWAEILVFYNMIPLAIRQAFEMPFTRPGETKSHSLKFFMGQAPTMMDQFGLGFGRRSGDPSWKGVYGINTTQFNVDRLSRYNIGVNMTYQAPGDNLLVHEFGHHLDFTYNRLWPTADGTMKRLVETAVFIDLWNEVKAAIPAPLYGANNIQEWFAEVFQAQIVPQQSMYLSLCGGSSDAAVRLRAEFTSRLPMPAFTGY